MREKVWNGRQKRLGVARKASKRSQTAAGCDRMPLGGWMAVRLTTDPSACWPWQITAGVGKTGKNRTDEG